MASAIDYDSSDDERASGEPASAAQVPSASTMIRGALVESAPEPLLSLKAAGSTHVEGHVAGPLLPGPLGALGAGALPEGTTSLGSGGIVKRVEADDNFFRRQLANMHSLGFAADPSGGAGFVGDGAAASAMRGFDSRDAALTRAQRRALGAARDAAELSGQARVGWGRSRVTAVERGELTEAMRRHRKELGLPEDELEEGEGGRPAGDDGAEGTAGGAGASASSSAGGESLAAARRRRRREKDGGGAKDGMAAEAVTSDFLGKSETDYQGRSWLEPPAAERAAAAADPSDRASMAPRRCIHRYTGHSKGVQDIAFFPDTGHMLLTASLDNTVRIWQTSATRKCQRVYAGHTAGVRQVTFRADGGSFASASFDTHVKLWDTETGACTGTYQTAAKGTPACVTFYPGDENVFVVGGSDRKVSQFDARTGEIVQTYDYHLDNVLTATYYDDGRKLVTTSDDKKIFVWEHGINVPMRQIQDPAMHAMPCAVMHPSQDMWCGQAMNNQIVVYNVSPKFRINRKAKFTGHISAGYACQLSVSPDGQFMASGDGHGRLWVWDWKSRKPASRLRAHDAGPCIGCVWHPAMGDVLATCGWDGTAKLWGSASTK